MFGGAKGSGDLGCALMTTAESRSYLTTLALPRRDQIFFKNSAHLIHEAACMPKNQESSPNAAETLDDKSLKRIEKQEGHIVLPAPCTRTILLLAVHQVGACIDGVYQAPNTFLEGPGGG